ncbi:MAG: 4Fe-4S dicluster domain-containing protein [candidate division Zixibacteria bacterium]|nr:4Fe-4S dicluster domain-containing protein [candidate division Zixibacteria bacterium]
MAIPKATSVKPGSSKANKTGSWRTERPIFLEKECTDCRICVLICPDGVIFGADSKYYADLDYCKGCGMCAEECPVDDIEMKPEVK